MRTTSTLSWSVLLLCASTATALAADIPMGDGKHTTSAKKGSVFTCQQNFQSGAGARADGPWIHGSSWDPSAKLIVDGAVSWPGKVTFTISGDKRVISGNNLPISHTTGTFPISSSDDVYTYDRNPNSIKEQTISLSLPVAPTLAASPTCVGGEVGIMLSGVPIFNAFDAEGRDAVAHEVQDTCSGHPQEKGVYHYHGRSTCLNTSNSQNKLVGYALDGFGIYDQYDDTGKKLVSADLDECHGTTSSVLWEGQMVNMYHYVLTEDFPYSVSCFKGTPVSKATGVGPGGNSSTGRMGPPMMNGPGMGNGMMNSSRMMGPPPGMGSGMMMKPPMSRAMQSSASSAKALTPAEERKQKRYEARMKRRAKMMNSSGSSQSAASSGVMKPKPAMMKPY